MHICMQSKLKEGLSNSKKNNNNKVCLYRLLTSGFLNSSKYGFLSPPPWSKEGTFHRGDLFPVFKERKGQGALFAVAACQTSNFNSK